MAAATVMRDSGVGTNRQPKAQAPGQPGSGNSPVPSKMGTRIDEALNQPATPGSPPPAGQKDSPPPQSKMQGIPGFEGLTTKAAIVSPDGRRVTWYTRDGATRTATITAEQRDFILKKQGKHIDKDSISPEF